MAEIKPCRLCLFGGTFDPIHNAHLQIASEALKRFALDQVLFIPASHPPHKSDGSLAPYEDRLKMIELACRPYPKFCASRMEDGEEPSYSIETIERFRRTLDPADEVFFLIGSDAFNEIDTWHRWRDLLALTRFIVVARPGGPYRIPEHARVDVLEGLNIPISSSSIRERLMHGEETPELPKAVRAYIEEHGLYGAPFDLSARS